MKKIMTILAALILTSTLLFSCQDEPIKPQSEGARTESNPNAWN